MFYSQGSKFHVSSWTKCKNWIPRKKVFYYIKCIIPHKSNELHKFFKNQIGECSFCHWSRNRVYAISHCISLELTSLFFLDYNTIEIEIKSGLYNALYADAVMERNIAHLPNNEISCFIIFLNRNFEKKNDHLLGAFMIWGISVFKEWLIQ